MGQSSDSPAFTSSVSLNVCAGAVLDSLRVCTERDGHCGRC